MSKFKKNEKPIKAKRINTLLIPKWKKRSVNTNQEHLTKYTKDSYKNVFLGDSMIERWLTTGASYWNNHYDKDSANLGVGGDGIQHLLHRLTNGNVLDGIKTDKVIIMIGTNNIETKSVRDIFEGLMNIINIVRKKQRMRN